MKTLFFLIAFLLIPFFANAKKKVPFIYLDRDQTLHVTIVDNVYDGGSETDRYAYIEESLREVLELSKFPMESKIERVPARTPEDQPEVQVFLHSWGDNGMGEIEVSMSATLKRNPRSREKNRLGFFEYSDRSPPFTTIERTTAKNIEVLRKTLAKLVAELNTHFEMELDETNPGETSPEN